MTCDDYFRTSCASVSLIMFEVCLICLQIFVSRVELPASAVTWTVLEFNKNECHILYHCINIYIYMYTYMYIYNIRIHINNFKLFFLYDLYMYMRVYVI